MVFYACKMKSTDSNAMHTTCNRTSKSNVLCAQLRPVAHRRAPPPPKGGAVQGSNPCVSGAVLFESCQQQFTPFILPDETRHLAHSKETPPWPAEPADLTLAGSAPAAADRPARRFQ